MSKPLRVTHRDIARRYGCDKSTVSLALRGSPQVSAETRRRIRELAEEMGYQPDPTVAKLARHRWARKKAGPGETLVYLINRDRESSEVWLQRLFLEPARRGAEARGYQLIEFDLSAYPSGDAASNVLYNRGIQGLILPPMLRSAESALQGRGWDRFTIVCCSIGWLRTPHHWVAPDLFESTRRVWQRVVARGYQRIGAALFRHDPVAEDDFTRLGASYAEQVELVPPERRIPFLRSGPKDRDAFFAWLDRHKPDVVISTFNRAYEWLVSAGYRIPEDLAFACLTVWPTDRCAGMSVQINEVGKAAVDFLVSQMLDYQRGVPEIQQCLLLEPRWVEGETLPVVGEPAAAVAEPQTDVGARPRIRRRA